MKLQTSYSALGEDTCNWVNIQLEYFIGWWFLCRILAKISVTVSLSTIRKYILCHNFASSHKILSVEEARLLINSDI